MNHHYRHLIEPPHRGKNDRKVDQKSKESK
jgi:hypothetical protein